ncbi:MAG: hypothetical protein ACRC80_04120, partial [Waterburya sp.]
DEVEQTLWHLFSSDTCKKFRVAIISTFARLLAYVIETGGKVIAADADLSAIGLNFLQACCQEPALVIENKYYPETKTPLHIYEDSNPGEQIAQLQSALERGERAILFTASVKAKYKWSSTNLEAYFKQALPKLKILRLDSETNLLDGNINNLISGYDLVIASPVIETGISIDDGHFDSVWAIANGLQSIQSVVQTLARVRSSIPRHLWAVKNNNRNGIGHDNSSNWKHLKYSTSKIANLSGKFEDKDFIIEQAENTWAKYSALINLSLLRYRENLIDTLVNKEGYQLIENTADKDYPPSTWLNNELKELAQNNYQTFCKKVADAEISPLSKAMIKTETEMLSEKKSELAQKYG